MEPHQPFELSVLNRGDPPAFNWMPDSQHVVFSHHINPGDGGLWIGNTRTGKIQRLTTSALIEDYPSISPDGFSILHDRIMIDYDIVKAPLDGTRSVPVYSTAFPEYSPSLTLSGDMAYITDRDDYAEIRLRSVDGIDRQIVGQQDFAPEDQPVLIWPPAVLSPDGRTIVFQGIRHGSNINQTSYIASTDGSGTISLISDSDYFAVEMVTWSPDSNWLAGNVIQSGQDQRMSIINRNGDPETITGA